ncbi:hypothetical protein Scep_014455 [Stephania cephalantha]|uniref:Uncharacterized protein n=1 Tax=Stephania cephalantha TaxID=152367 RepID=A0AAP0J1A5_9MAGN
MAPFGIYLGCASGEATVGLGTIKADLVPPYQSLKLVCSQVALSPRVKCQDNIGAYPLLSGVISELENIDERHIYVI